MIDQYPLNIHDIFTLLKTIVFGLLIGENRMIIGLFVEIISQCDWWAGGWMGRQATDGQDRPINALSRTDVRNKSKILVVNLI